MRSVNVHTAMKAAVGEILGESDLIGSPEQESALTNLFKYGRRDGKEIFRSGWGDYSVRGFANTFDLADGKQGLQVVLLVGELASTEPVMDDLGFPRVGDDGTPMQRTNWDLLYKQVIRDATSPKEAIEQAKERGKELVTAWREVNLSDAVDDTCYVLVDGEEVTLTAALAGTE